MQGTLRQLNGNNRRRASPLKRVGDAIQVVLEQVGVAVQSHGGRIMPLYCRAMSESSYMQFASLFGGVAPGDVMVIRGEGGARIVPTLSALGPELADLTSRLQDLKKTIEYCKLHEGMEDPAGGVSMIKTAVAEAAIMTYGRAFSRDARVAATLSLDVFESMPGAAREVHDHFIFLRNKFLAHSENPYEEVLVGLKLAEYPAPRSVTGVHVAHVSLTDFSGTGALTQLAEALLVPGRKRVDRLTRSLLAESQRLDPEVVYERQDLSYAMPAPESAGTKRPRPGA